MHEDLSAGDSQSLDAFGRAIGIAFQIQDDVLDVAGETDVIGKPAGSDERRGKATYPGLFGLDRSRQRCDELLDTALRNLDTFGEDASPLRWLAEVPAPDWPGYHRAD